METPLDISHGPKDYNPKTKRWVKKCPSGKVRNLATFKCVTDKEAGCPEGKERNEKTGRCIKIKKTRTKKKVNDASECPPGTVFNPKTRRCNKAKTILKCKEGQVNHPVTGKCISILKLKLIQEEGGDQKGEPIIIIKEPSKDDLPCVKRSNLKLRAYQENVQKFLATNRGLIAVHGVGTGKTLTSVTASQCFLDKNPTGKVIVSTPKSLLENFKKELKAYGAKTDDTRYVFLTHAGLVNIVKNKTEPLSYFNDALLILDEVHNFRTWPIAKIDKKKGKINRSGSAYAIKAAIASKQVLGLTATPVVNNLKDLQNPLSMIIGHQLTEFPKIKSSRFLTGAKTKLQKFRSLFSVYFRNENDPEYPAKYVTPVNIPMSKTQYNMYTNLESKLESQGKRFVPSFYISERKAVNILDEKNSPKIEWTMDMIKNQQKTLIYSSFRDFGSDHIAKRLGEANIKYAIIDGSKSIKSRKEAVENYNSPQSDLNVLLITKAGSEGLDLKGTRQVILYDPVWNDAVETQIIGRAVRRGSHKALAPEDRDVKVYKLLLSGPEGQETVDHIIARLIEQKRNLSSDALDMLNDLSIDNNLKF
tara:strand:- start:3870 stop:5636 length:1767 start_codon:yes stop_codon:yes gene_type:complete